MGDTGPCGPCSEIHIDRGPSFGPEGGPLNDPHGDRFMEFWNLVFMQYNQAPDGSRTRLPKPSIDTGAGLERNLAVLQGVDTVWDLDVFRPLIARAEAVTGVTYGTNPEHDVYLRILAEHARTMTFVVSDGVMPSNQERGYVLRRIIRRAVRHAYLLGAHDLVTPPMIDAVCDVMGAAYPKLLADRELVTRIIAREEASFRATLQRGTEMLDELLDRGDISGDDAFFLHDTLGFPVDLTREIAGERGRTVDLDGYTARMQEQRDRAREAAKEAGVLRTHPWSCSGSSSPNTAPPSSPDAPNTRPNTRRSLRSSRVASASRASRRSPRRSANGSAARASASNWLQSSGGWPLSSILRNTR